MLKAYLCDRCALLVLDNCEHLIDASADVVDVILTTCRSMSILATSREALQIEGEQTFRVPSLDTDNQDSGAVELFVSRARAVKADFEITDTNRDDTLAICQRLDGIPLAIELVGRR